MTDKALDADSAIQLLYALTAATSEAFGLEEAVATALAQPIVEALRRSYAREKLYIPAPDRSARNAAILADFNGRNSAEVCRKHGISRRTLYVLLQGPK